MYVIFFIGRLDCVCVITFAKSVAAVIKETCGKKSRAYLKFEDFSVGCEVEFFFHIVNSLICVRFPGFAKVVMIGKENTTIIGRNIHFRGA